MDSGSDWDSLAGDGEPSFPLSFKSSKQKPSIKEIIEISQKPLNGPLKQNQANKNKTSKVKSATVFVDQDDYDYKTGEDDFQSVDLEDESHLTKKFDRVEEKKRKKDHLEAPLGMKEKLPYTNFKVSTPDRKENSQEQQKQQQQQQRQQQYKQNNKKFDISNSWDMDDVVEEGVLHNDSSVYGGSNIQPNFGKHSFDTKNNTEVNHTSKKTVKAHTPNFPSMLSLYDVKEKPENQRKSDVTIPLQKKFYYETFYCNAHVVAIEDNSVIPKCADRLESHMRRGWQEIFGLFRILFDFLTIFIIELLRLLFSIVFQKFLVGIITITGDYLIKPLLSSVFNSILQPYFVCLWNITEGIRRFLQPSIQLLGDIIQQLSVILKSFRLFEYNHYTNGQVKSI